MTIATERWQRQALKKANKRFPAHLIQIPRVAWPTDNVPETIVEVWRSRDFLLQVHTTPVEGIERLSVCRTALSGDSWKDGISWDDLQRLKSECGRGDKCAVEVYPEDGHIVNVANMRHLFVLDTPPAYAWRKP